MPGKFQKYHQMVLLYKICQLLYMSIQFMKINSGNKNSPSSPMKRVNYHYHTKIKVITQKFPPMLAFCHPC